MSDTLAVAFTVTGVERFPTGKLAALSNVELDVAGVVLVLQGVRVIRDPGGRLAVLAPAFRDGGGTWRSAIVLPDSLRDALGAAVLEHLETASEATHR